MEEILEFEEDGATASFEQNSALKCVICIKEAQKADLCSPVNDKSWQTLLSAAEVHKAQLILQYKDKEGIPDIYYHLKCRKKFTHKKSLEKLQRDQAELSNELELNQESTSSREKRKVGESSVRILEKICIFCGKASKYLKGKDKREPLVQSIDLRSDSTVRDIAIKKMDTKMIAITSRELVAAEAHYHKSCYRNYTRHKNNDTEPNNESNELTEYSTKEREAFKMLFDYIRLEVFPNPMVIPLTSLTEKLVQNMIIIGVSAVKTHTKKHIRRSLEKEFGNNLDFISDNNGKLLVVPDTLTRHALVIENALLVSKNNSLLSKGNEHLMKNCALHIRQEVKISCVKQDKPPQPENLGPEAIVVPPSLNTLLETMITGDIGTGTLTPAMTTVLESIAQDCVYAITRGVYKPPKHVLLPWTVKSLTGNVELIRILNRFGHSIYYSQLEEIETALCLHKIENTEESNIPIPANFYVKVPTILAYDNIDRLEETLSGAGTSHRVNGIILQPKTATSELPPSVLNRKKDKKRCISASMRSLSPYNAGNRVGPPEMEPQELDYMKVVETARNKNILWIVTRQFETTTQVVSSWTGFNILCRNQIQVPPNKIGYLPTINAPATDLSTVNEILNQSLKICQNLDLQDIVVVFDQAIYSKAAEILWKNAEYFKPIVIRMGDFHTMCTLLAIIGKRFRDSGLRDLAVESGVIAEASIDSVLDGRRYNRGVRLHKLIYESLLRLAWNGFEEWLHTNRKENLIDLEDFISQISVFRESITQEKFESLLKDSSYHRITNLFSSFLNTLKTERGDLASFWASYIELVEILLGLIRAAREGNWILHLAMIRKMIPWCFAYDRQNYARYLPVYYNDMTKLESDHPEVYDYFLSGGFSVQLDSLNPFGKIPVDQTIEETVNKDTQTPGGTKGFSLNAGAVSRFYITSEYRSTCLKNIRAMTLTRNSSSTHTDLQPARIKRDEHDVQLLTDILENTWINPFSTCNDLMSLSTGRIPSNEIKHDLLQAREKGESAYQKFQDSRLGPVANKNSFFERLPKLNLRTFKNMDNSKVSKSTKKEAILKADHRVFGHMVLVAASRNLDMKHVLEYPLGPLPWSIANSDGTMKKTNKAALARKLEGRTSIAETIPTPSACIIDGLALLHKVNGDNKTFEELCEAIFNTVAITGTDCERIDVVFDVYQEISIKNAERQNRSTNTGVLYNNIFPGHKIKNWKRLLACPVSKTALIKFLADQWRRPIYLDKLGNKEMFVACEEKCYKLTRNGSAIFDELKSTHEEADTRLLLHAKQASPRFHSIIIVSEDTDVLILSIAFNEEIENVFVRCGTKQRTRFICVKKLANSLGKDACSALLGLHSFTGCDTVSAFSGRGKVTGLKWITENGDLQKAMCELGTCWELKNELFDKLQAFTCKLYATTTTSKLVNDLRYDLFRVKKGEIDSSQLPPCRDSLYQHCLRSNYQAAIWRRSLESEPFIPSPEGHGWKIKEGEISILWMTASPAPIAVLELMACQCKKKCKLPTCKCMANEIHCSPACYLEECENMMEESINAGHDESDDDDINL